ncbi:ATPase [Candidatus Woesearchaeota archaeon CG_4_10_14_0_2_um_filter_33_10]|nr:MAG: ATPase [Candidatus Woesearchaeota archaeon CG06_land_8_20_14_3_00_33_13]PIZ52314.1 MAG: ATPase [Candidatus Woesearchaeota archaeon CG_4_10_14_0_2_um_filter_33_10]
MDYYNYSVNKTLDEFKTSEKGLSQQDAEQRLEKYGLNEIKEEKKISVFQMFFSQFKSSLIIILLAAIILTLIIGEYADSALITIIVIVNALLGFAQEYKAEKSIEALKKLASLKATVIRDGKKERILAKDLVLGDIIRLEEGEKIPADARLIEVISLETHESALTGESTSVAKEISEIKGKKSIAEQSNMVFSGTVITRGRGKAIVIRTGMRTEIGRIAEMMQSEEKEQTPLQLTLAKLGKLLGIAVIIVCIIVFLTGLLRGNNAVEMFKSAIALAVAAIPEGLPAVVTITLALGVTRLVRKNALIRKLHSVETLGCTNVICTDKTGTLTKDEMTVKEIFVNNKLIKVTGQGYSTEGLFLDSKPGDYELLLRISSLCNNASISNEKILGDPTETALLVCASKASLSREELEQEFPRIHEIPFDSERKMMTTIHQNKNKEIAFVKGGPKQVIDNCSFYYENGKIIKLTKSKKDEFLEKNREMASKALRVLAMAFRELPEKVKYSSETLEKNLVFVGLTGMIDPPRAEIKDAIKLCRKAGIRVIMLTGDQRTTAKAIGIQIGLINKDEKIITGMDITEFSDTEFDNIVKDVNIFARISPKDKIRIVDSLKKYGNVVAMTGDGVNDAPALKKADIGIAMGITGTDVSKEASDIILTDDNFASIVNAIKEGRGIYDNIKKFVEYLLSSNLGEILVIFVAMLIGMPLPLIAIHILWINLATDGLPALALSVDPAEPGIMERKPRKKDSKIFSKNVVLRMMAVGIIMCVGTLALFKLYDPVNNLVYAQTMAFSTIMMFQMFNVLNCRSEKNSLFKIGIFSNKYLIGAIVISILLQVIVIYTPLAIFFKTVPLSLVDWIYIILMSSTVLIFGETIKLIRNKINKPIED